jgi:hypothetical protein
MKQIRPATEAEVISEFLKNEFYQKEYHADRHQFERLVLSPDITDEEQNALRKQLLFRRHRVTWKELPKDVRWSLIQLDVDDVERMRIFPRGHWPKLATQSSFAVSDLVRSIRQRMFPADIAEDVTAIQAIAYHLRQQPDRSSVMLIGVGDKHPLTILEGNHRILAAALISDETITEFTTYAGISPSMNECLWYQKSVENMFRYACRRLCDFRPSLLRDLKQRWAS